jgi:CTP synthase
MIDSEMLEELDDEGLKSILEKYEGIIIPGGFGKRGIEGKIRALKFARTNNIPTLGICLGMQLMVVEYARNVKGLTEANSTEFDPKTNYPVIDIMEEQKKILKMGGTMRLGAQKTEVIKGTKLYDIYKSTEIHERHRHRYEVNHKQFGDIFDEMIVSARTEFIEAVEVKDNDFYIGIQYHPELKSKVGAPNPIFTAFKEAIEQRRNK